MPINTEEGCRKAGWYWHGPWCHGTIEEGKKGFVKNDEDCLAIKDQGKCLSYKGSIAPCRWKPARCDREMITF